jgi:hypothetical protein
MADECVVAVYRNIAQAQHAIGKLTNSGFPAAKISIVTTGLREHPEIVKELELADDSLHDAAIVAGLGSVVGALSGLGVMLTSRLGAVFLFGPVGGAIVGGITGGFVGAMAGTGVHQTKMDHYERLIKRGHVLLIASDGPVELAHAYRLLQGKDVVELHEYARSANEAPEAV